MTESRQYVRALLYGCSHRPKWSAMYAPKKGDNVHCYACGRDRTCVGILTGWSEAAVKCTRCEWSYASQKDTKKKLFNLAHRHADARDHVVNVTRDGYTSKVKPRVGAQLVLVDDLLLP